MYQGRFSSARVREDVPEMELTPEQILEQEQEKAAKQSEPAQYQEPEQQPEKKQKPKKKRKLGTILFYSIYGVLVLGVLGAMIGLMFPLHNWLEQYEASQPETKQAEVFNQLFKDPDWEALYTQAEVADTTFESKQAYAAYMEEKVGDQALGCMETSAGLSGDRKYIVRLGEEKIASFILFDKTEGKEPIADWELGQVELFMTRSQSVTVEKAPGQTVYINGVALDDSYTIRSVTTGADAYLPEGLHGYGMQQQYVDGLLVQPEVVVKDAQGNPVETRVDENGMISAMPQQEMEISQQENSIAIAAAKANALYAIRAISSWELQKHFDAGSQIYTDICNTASFMQAYTDHGFVEDSIEVRDYYRYSDTMFSANVTLKLNVTCTNGTVKTYDASSTYFFTKKSSGEYRVTDMTNIPVQERKEQVRITFVLEEGNDSRMVASDAKSLELPQITAPQGQKLSGWAKQEQDENGRNVLVIVFAPTEDGIVHLSGEEALKPMTLYPVFEKE